MKNKTLIILLFVFLIIESMCVFGSPTGGTITTSGGYTIHTFTSSGNFVSDMNLTNVEILYIGGGGAGGSYYGGGGGSGGMLECSNVNISVGTFFASIGTGGAGTGGDGYSGLPTSFYNRTANGGGYGAGGADNGNGQNGGSGGGGTANTGLGGQWTGTNYTNCIAYGNNGGSGTAPGTGGGGGGSNGTGQTVSANTYAQGGLGRYNSINGSNVMYARGGNGTSDTVQPIIQGYNETGNTGNGGAGARNGGIGGKGADGILIIKYVLSETISNFSITAINNYNSIAISNFNATISSGTTQYNYSTTTGTITTQILSNSTSLWNLTIRAQNQFNNVSTNLNVSTAYVGRLDQYQIIILQNKWNQSNLTYANISINGTLYTTNSTNIYTPYNSISLITTVNISNYIYTTQNISFTKNTLQIINVSQSIINFSCFEKISNLQINCLNNSNVSAGTTIYPNAGVYNWVVSANTSTKSYYNISTIQTINYLDVNTINVTGFYSTNLTINSTSIYGTLSSCLYNISSYNYTSFSDVITGSPSSNIGLIDGIYKVVAMCSGFAYETQNITINSVVQSLNFSLYTTNSFNIMFYDEITKSLLNGFNVSLELISDSYSENYSTSNGTLYIDLLTPEFYLFRYKSLPDYDERFYYYTLTNNSFNNISLYLINDSQTITVTVRDEDNNLISGAYLKIQRYDLNTNAYTTREIVKTDVIGNAYFQGKLNSEFYKYIVEYPIGVVVLTTSPDYIRSATITLRVNLQQSSMDDYFTSINTYSNLSFNNETNSFRCYYNDASNGVTQGCLYVYKGDDLTNSSCVDSSSATIILGIANDTGVTYVSQCLIIINGETYLLKTLSHTFSKTITQDAKNNFFILTILLTLIIGFITITNLTVFFIITPLPIFIMSLIHMIPLSRGVGITILLIGLTLAFLTSKRS